MHESASAARLCWPSMWWISEVYWGMKSRWWICLGVYLSSLAERKLVACDQWEHEIVYLRVHGENVWWWGTKCILQAALYQMYCIWFRLAWGFREVSKWAPLVVNKLLKNSSYSSVWSISDNICQGSWWWVWEESGVCQSLFSCIEGSHWGVSPCQFFVLVDRW